MSLQFPLGLLALLGIPVLILIYIIKSKYTEQTIASTYIWRLSEKFLKRRRPISKLTGILSLILQILAVAAASLLIAHPVFTIPGSANDFYFVLDGSASMNMQSDGSTRFERAQKEICNLIDGSLGGSSYSLVFASDTTEVVFESIRNKEQAKTTVNELTAGWGAADCLSALPDAQNYFDFNNSAEVYLITDKEYDTGNVTLINVAKNENNYALIEYSYTGTATGTVASGKVVSYDKDATITVVLSAGKNGSNKLEEMGKATVNATMAEPADFVISSSRTSYDYLQISISDDDALAEDNVVVLYDKTKSDARKVLYVTDDAQGAAFLVSAIRLAGNASVEVCSLNGDNGYTEKTADDLQKYGLFVFDGVDLSSGNSLTIPKNAAVWLVGIEGEVVGSDLTYRDTETKRDLEDFYALTFNMGNATQEKIFREGLKDDPYRQLILDDKGTTNAKTHQYVKYGNTEKFTTVIKAGSDPVVFAGLNKNNDRQVVFSFRIIDSNLGYAGVIASGFNQLVRNLINYSFPEVINKTAYVCGDIMAVNVVPGCENIVVTSPSGKSTTLDTVNNDVCEVNLTEAGTYTVIVRKKGIDAEQLSYAFARVPEEESRTADVVNAFILEGVKGNKRSDGYYDDLLAFIILLAVLLLADWGVYCYEQYQLR